jgi:hypothetical protein
VIKLSKNCQSCGMPFSKDIHGSRFEKDGKKYSHCYHDDTFTMPNLTVQEMKK